MISKLLSARPRVSAALATAPQQAFTSAQLAAIGAKDQSAQSDMMGKKKKKSPLSTAFANMKGSF